jgi:hypothetical protein
MNKISHGIAPVGCTILNKHNIPLYQSREQQHVRERSIQACHMTMLLARAVGLQNIIRTKNMKLIEFSSINLVSVTDTLKVKAQVNI